jgi:shikimate kinase
VRADKAYLVGFMGAGKTTVGRALAKRLHWDLEDIDERIERRERRDIPTIFRQEGEPYFRAAEQQEVIALLPSRGVVVATGGGTIVDPVTRELILRDGAVIWLDVPLAVLLERVPLDGSRPLAADRITMESLYNQRLMAYSRAHLRVDAGRTSIEDLVEQIVDWLRA